MREKKRPAGKPMKRATNKAGKKAVMGQKTNAKKARRRANQKPTSARRRAANSKHY